MKDRSPATTANRYEGFGNGSSQRAQCRPSSVSPLATRLPLGEQHRKVGPRGAQRCGEAGEHVRTVRVEGDAPEILRLALGAEHPVRGIEPLVAGVALGKNASSHPEREGRAGVGRLRPPLLPVEEGGGKNEPAVIIEAVLVRGERTPFEIYVHELQIGAVENERNVGRSAGRAPQPQIRGDERFRRRELEVEVDAIDEKGRRAIVFEPHFPGVCTLPGALRIHGSCSPSEVCGSCRMGTAVFRCMDCAMIVIHLRG